LAEAQVEVFRQMQESTLATKEDIKDLKSDIGHIRGEITQVKTELHGEIVLVKTELQGEIAQAVRDMKIWFGSMLVVAVTVLATLNKVL
jgi:hypothetical protein